MKTDGFAITVDEIDAKDERGSQEASRMRHVGVIILVPRLKAGLDLSTILISQVT